MKIYKALFIASIITFVSSCSDDNTAPATISVTTISGVKITLAGAYKTSCLNDGSGNGFIETINFDGASWSFTAEAWSGDPLCSNSPTTTESVSASSTENTSDISITGWVLSVGSAATPPVASDSSGPLSNTESVTPITVIITESGFGFPIGGSGSLFYVVDDTTASTILYQDDDADSNSNAISDRAYVQ